jgi:F-type H+-transporting ATPase subunit epsilon
MAFQCTLVTPEQQVLDEQITQAIVPAHDGKVGVLTRRAPLLVKLGLGELRLDLAGGGKRVFFIDGGVAQMKDDVLTIVTDEAVPQADIDAESARAELAEATAQVATDPKSYENRQHRINRARTLQAMAGSR